MLAQLFILAPNSLSHARLGQPKDHNELIRLASKMPALYPYVTDMGLHTLWVHPACLPDSDTLKAYLQKHGPKPRIARQRHAKQFPGTLTTTGAVSA